MSGLRTVLITGACGNLGTKLRHHLKGRYDLRLLDISPGDDGEVLEVDLRKWNNDWVRHFVGVDTVVHLAAKARTSLEWHEVIEPNLDAVLNVYNAAAMSNVRRVVFASSNHAMGRYKDIDEPDVIGPDTVVRPGTLIGRGERHHDSLPYGALKLVGERIGKSYADALGLSTIALRIGWVKEGENPTPRPDQSDSWLRLMWMSNRDMCQLFEKCITADHAIRFAVLNGMSNNTGMRWDIASARELIGYEPEDGFESNTATDH